MNCQDGPEQPYYYDCEAELDNELGKAEKHYRLEVSQDPDHPIYMQAAARILHRRGVIEDSEGLCSEAIACAGYRPGCGNAMVTSLIRGTLGGQ